MIFPLSRSRRCIAAAALAAAMLTALPMRGHAQVAAVVNGDPVTTFDVEQRMKLTAMTSPKPTTKQQVLEELIDEKLKIQLIRRFSIEGMDKDVDNAFANMARRMKTTPQGLTEILAKSGITPATLKQRIRAEITWNQIIRGRYQSSFQISDKDILAKLDEKKPGEKELVGYDYTLRPILFVVPKGSPPGLMETRKREAEALRARFEGCESGVAIARGLREVAVRGSVVKTSAELPPQLREILEKTAIGKLTLPEVTAQGVEVYALCDRKQSSAENVPGRREIRDELFSERFQTHSTKLLKELRSQAMIEYR
jgi:peptidyl-prolyl cis-trans isomerase SurA